MLPEVDIKLQAEIGFSDLRPAELVEHQMAMLKRAIKEMELQNAPGNAKNPED